MASTLGPTQTGHSPFKKRVLRPWKSALPPEEITHQADIHTELLEKQLETSLESKTKQEEALQAQFSLLENNCITIGGFFQPGSLLAAKPKEVLQKTQVLLNKLNQKEQEILTINHQLQLNQAQEQINRAQTDYQAEAAARHAAEAKAEEALDQAEQARARIQQMEEELYQAHHLQVQMEVTVLNLEENLRAAEQKLGSSEEKYTLEIQALIRNLQVEQQASASARQSHQQTQQALQGSLEKTALLQEKIAQLQQEKIMLESERSFLDQQFHKLGKVVENERTLRKLFEQKIGDIATEKFALELRLQAEATARQAAEAKNRHLVEQVSHAVLQVLETA